MPGETSEDDEIRRALEELDRQKTPPIQQALYSGGVEQSTPSERSTSEQPSGGLATPRGNTASPPHLMVPAAPRKAVQQMSPELTRSLIQAVNELVEMRTKMIPMERKLDAIMEQYAFHDLAGDEDARGETPTRSPGTGPNNGNREPSQQPEDDEERGDAQLDDHTDLGGPGNGPEEETVSNRLPHGSLWNAGGVQRPHPGRPESRNVGFDGDDSGRRGHQRQESLTGRQESGSPINGYEREREPSMPPSGYRGRAGSATPWADRLTDPLRVRPLMGGAVDTIEETSIARIRNMISIMVGDSPRDEPPAYLRMAKMSVPPPYDGTDDIGKFELWLNSLLEYYATLRITGPRMDLDRVRILGDAVKGDAADWLYTNVKAPFRDQERWTFEETIVGLHKRFIHKNFAQSAVDGFEKEKYDADRGGVPGLFERLRSHAVRMTEAPSEYQWKERLLSALPESIVRTIHITYGLQLQTSPFAEIYTAALKIERGLEDVSIVSAKRARLGTSLKDKGATTTKEVNSAPVQKNGPLPFRGFKPRAGNGRPFTAAPKYAEKRTDGPTGAATTQTQPKAASGTKPTDNRKASSTLCYACGQSGHYSSDPKCPKYGTRGQHRPERMYAQRVVDDRSDDETDQSQGQARGAQDQDYDREAPADDAGATEYPESVYEGSQYDSEEERYQEYPDDHSGYEENEEDLTVRFGAIRCAAMRTTGSGAKVRSHMAVTAAPPLRGLKSAWLYNTRASRLNDPKEQPRQSPGAQRTMCAEVKINGVTAYALFDSCCTTDSITPELAYLCKADRIDLAEQVGLQLGTKGSKTRINYGAKAQLEVGDVKASHYFDVVDIDRYDAILGTVFCNTYGVCLDFGEHTVRIKGKDIPLYTAEQEAAVIAERTEQRQRRTSAQLHSAHVAETLAQARVVRRPGTEIVNDDDSA